MKNFTDALCSKLGTTQIEEEEEYKINILSRVGYGIAQSE
jgi:hypothetical protein